MNISNEQMVSVITPVFNSEKYISETLESILNQTYNNLEVICVDDMSTDNSHHIIEEYMKIDSRVKYIKLDTKGGASIARNVGISNAKGSYIAFLDADDTWKLDKLEKQLKFMSDFGHSFTFSAFSVIDESGVETRSLTPIPNKINYEQLLRRNIIGCLTVVYDRRVVGLVQIPRIDKRNDFALWLAILKKIDYAYYYPEVLSTYRQVSTSLSNSRPKFTLIKYHFFLFRKLEKMSFFRAIYYTLINIINVNKRSTRRREVIS